MATLRIAVVDDHPLMRAGIEHTLRSVEDFEVVGSGGSAEEAITIARDLSPDILLLDIAMPGGGMAAARHIARAHPETRILFLTVSERHDDVSEALNLGARGYVLKGISGPDLVQTIRSVSAGENYITPQFAARLLATRSHRSDAGPSDPLKQLNAREIQILKQVSCCCTNKEIANNLDLSEKTIKHYVSGILQKLSVRNRVEAIAASRKLNDGEGSQEN